MGQHIGFGDEDDTYVDFKLVGDRFIITSQYIMRFSTVQKAERDYVWLFGFDFSLGVDAPWQTPPDVSYVSPCADQFRMACTINNVAGPKQVCQVKGRYANYVMVFSSVVEPHTITLAGFNQAARAADQIMVRPLGLDRS